MVSVPTIRRDGAGRASKASLAGVPSHKQQGCAQTERGNTRGVTSAHILAAHKPQDRSSLLPARAGFLSIGAHLPVNWPGLRVRSLYARSAGSNRARDHSVRVLGSNPSRANTLAHQLPINRLADRSHVTRRLSSSPSSAGFKTSWKDLTCEAEPLSSDDKIHD